VPEATVEKSSNFDGSMSLDFGILHRWEKYLLILGMDERFGVEEQHCSQ
jgi:hypothetical protein